MSPSPSPTRWSASSAHSGTSEGPGSPAPRRRPELPPQGRLLSPRRPRRLALPEDVGLDCEGNLTGVRTPRDAPPSPELAMRAPHRAAEGPGYRRGWGTRLGEPGATGDGVRFAQLQVEGNAQEAPQGARWGRRPTSRRNPCM